MITLTTSYQMLAQKYLGNSYGDLYVRIYAKYLAQEIANNRTKVQYEARAYFSGNWIRDNQGTGNVSGTSASTVTGACTYPQKGETVIATTEAWVTHGSDGKKSISASAYLKFPNWGWSGTASGTAELPTIPRQANITAAPNFSDEGNPTITYSNPAGSIVESLQACIASNDGKTVYVPYREISKTDTSYTFELTEEERNTLRNACNASRSMTVKFYIKTKIGDNMLYSSLAKTLSIVNADPIITASAKDTNATALALTGDEKRMIEGFNTVLAEMSVTALKGATIVSHKITNSGKSVNIDSGTFSNVNSASFVFEATDSRGNTVTKTVDLTLINYITLTANISAKMTPEGVINITANGNYFNGSFGSEQNALVVQYRYKLHGGTYSDWTDATGNKIGNTYTADIAITGLDYRKRYVVQVRATDRLDRRNSVEKTMSCVPVFDWGENDFNFNVPVNIEGDIYIKGNSITDYIVEQGTSGIWRYKKWNSGQVELTARTSVTCPVQTKMNSIYRSEIQSVQLPFTVYKCTPIVTCLDHNTWASSSYINETSNSIGVVIWRGTTYNSYTWNISIIVTGRWK